MKLTQLCHISISPLLGCHSALAAVWIVGLVFACLWPPVPTVPVHGLHLLQFLHQVGWFQCIPEYLVALPTTMIVARASVFHTALANGVQLVVVQPQPQPQEIQQTQRHQEERFLQQSSDALQTTMIAVPAVVYLEVLASGVVESLLLQEQTAQMTTILYESRCFQPSRLMVNYESTTDDFYLHVKPASCSDGKSAQSISVLHFGQSLLY